MSVSADSLVIGAVLGISLSSIAGFTTQPPYPAMQEPIRAPGTPLPAAERLREHTASWRRLRTDAGTDTEIGTMHATLELVDGAYTYETQLRLGTRTMSYTYWLAPGSLQPLRSVYDDALGRADVQYTPDGVQGSILPPDGAEAEALQVTRPGGFFEAGTVPLVLAVSGLRLHLTH